MLSQILFLSLTKYRSAVSTMVKGTQILSAVTVVTAIPSIFASGTMSSLWNFISICQMVNYLLYLSIVWPENAQMVFNLFSAASFNFIPNPFQNTINSLNNLGNVIIIPDNFANNGVTGLFIQRFRINGYELGIIGSFLLNHKSGSLFSRRNSTGKIC